MKKNVNFHAFQDAFTQCGRGNNFSYEGLRALFDYLEQLEEETGQEIELDVIALCCEYMEIEEDEEAYKDYIGDDADSRLQEFIIAELAASVLVWQH